jgi:hypothetical protein
MIDERKRLTDHEVKAILERIPMTDRLAESERAEMKNHFLRAIKQASVGRAERLSSSRRRPLWWIGFGATATACAALAVFFFETNWNPSGTPGRQGGFDSQDLDEYYLFNESEAEIDSASPVISPATTEIDSTTRIQLNRVPWDSLCGPRAIWVAAARSGVNLDLGDVIKSCRVSQEGCSLWDLKQAAESFGFNAAGMRLNWESLLETDCPTVLMVRGNHFSCADPTEKSADGRIRYYDPPNSATWLTKEELLEIWNGESLVLSRSLAGAEVGPAIRFEAVVQDLGDRTDVNSVSGVFPFQNRGDQPLEILDINHSCGCIHTEVTKNPVPPGETAEVIAELGLQGIDGARSELIEVQTNDPTNPSVTLVLQARHERTLLVSQDFVDFGMVTVSQPSERSFLIEDKSKSGIPILGVEPFLEGDQEEVAPEVDVWIDKVVNLAGPPNRTHEIGLNASVSPDTPFGTYQGKIQIVAGEEGDRILEVAFQMTVDSDYLLTPAHISFGVVREGEAVRRSLTVVDRANRPIRLVDHKIKYDTKLCSISMVEPSRKSSSMPIDLSLSIPEFESNGTTVAKGALILQPENGPELEVPWSAIVKKGR